MKFDNRKYQRERARSRRSQGLCLDCAVPVGVLRSGRPGVRCRPCAKTASGRGRRLYAELRELGLCMACRAPVAETNPKTGRKLVRCPTCRADRAIKQNAAVEDRGA